MCILRSSWCCSRCGAVRLSSTPRLSSWPRTRSTTTRIIRWRRTSTIRCPSAAGRIIARVCRWRPTILSCCQLKLRNGVRFFSVWYSHEVIISNADLPSTIQSSRFRHQSTSDTLNLHEATRAKSLFQNLRLYRMHACSPLCWRGLRVVSANWHPTVTSASLPTSPHLTTSDSALLARPWSNSVFSSTLTRTKESNWNNSQNLVGHLGWSRLIGRLGWRSHPD